MGRQTRVPFGSALRPCTWDSAGSYCWVSAHIQEWGRRGRNEWKRRWQARNISFGDRKVWLWEDFKRQISRTKITLVSTLLLSFLSLLSPSWNVPLNFGTPVVSGCFHLQVTESLKQEVQWWEVPGLIERCNNAIEKPSSCSLPSTILTVSQMFTFRVVR